MFDDKNLTGAGGQAVPPGTAASTAAEDMFDGLDQAASPERPKPAVFLPKDQTAADQPETEETKSDPKKFLVLGGMAFALLLLAAGGWFGYKKFSGVLTGPADEVLPAAENQPAASNGLSDEPAPVQPEAKTQTATVGNVEGSAATSAKASDSDDDGLSDEEEAALGTDPKSVDSDGDGLFDYEEAKVYGSDPKKSDTDGDGYGDGQEVKGGYNPLGWGKLFDNPAQKR